MIRMAINGAVQHLHDKLEIDAVLIRLDSHANHDVSYRDGLKACVCLFIQKLMGSRNLAVHMIP